jgi:CheY-like chemotaxis protein
MSTKVLVFESDPAFAGELRTELGKLGCTTTVVEDGNLGLQQAGSEKPDLILLSIELPRMNGFSVCNKLKKDPGLKDVPLIIMSSESSDETFEQHKKLRTRAEDYVHKPIAFGELLQHIQGFVEIGAVAGGEGEAIVIEEDIESGDYLVEDDGTATQEPPKSKVDADVEAFAEDAFGRLTDDAAPPPPPVAQAAPAAPAAPVATNGAAAEAKAAPRKSAIPAARVPSLHPAARPGVDQAEHDKVVGELGRAKERLAATDAELADAKRDIDKLRMDAGEAERLAREVEELKTKLTSGAGAKPAGVSSREFLDLREGLNKKDKEILSLKEQSSKKDKEIVESQEKMLALERSKADLDDRLLSLERELDEAKEKAESVSAEAAGSRKAADDLKARLEKATADLEAKESNLAEARNKAAADVASLEAKLGAARAEAEQSIANARGDASRSADEAEARRKADLEQAKRDQETALAEAAERAADEQKRAVDARAEELAREHGGKLHEQKATHEKSLAAAREEHEKSLVGAREEHEKRLEEAKAEAAEAARAADRKREEEVAAARKDGQDRLAHASEDAIKRTEETLEALRKEHAEKVSSVENDRDARIATIESKASRELGEANDRLAKIEVDFSGVRGELESLRETKRVDDAAHATKVANLEAQVSSVIAAREELEKTLASTTEKLRGETSRADKAKAKWEADKQSLDRAKDALAVALSQIEDAEGRTP